MRLVDGEERDPAARQELEAARRHQALRRDIDEIERALAHVALDLGGLGRRQRRIEVSRAHAGLAQRIDLILHQGDQRRDDNADTRPQQRGNLVAQRLAAARRHQDERVTSGRDAVDDRRLPAPERAIAEHGLKNFKGPVPRRGQ